MTVLRGSCLCGAVRFEVTGPLTMMLRGIYFQARLNSSSRAQTMACP
jgi:hypothetical protein